jgi:hypothetical protein
LWRTAALGRPRKRARIIRSLMTSLSGRVRRILRLINRTPRFVLQAGRQCCQVLPTSSVDPGKLCCRRSYVFGGSKCFGRNVCAVRPTDCSAGEEELLKSAFLPQRLEDRAAKPPREIYRLHRTIAETEAKPISGGVPSVYDRDELVHSGSILAEQSGLEDRASSLM